MKRLLVCLFSFLAASFLVRAAEAPPSVAGFTFVKSSGGISEYKFDANGLQVLLMPDHSVPVVTYMVTFHVGSRNEVTGTTGATHILEHMMFKGSAHYNYDIGTGFDTVLDKIGANNNATTWLDRTNYYEDLASDHLELAVQIESDRMRGLLLRDKDRQPEMTVVRNEYERGENDPVEALEKEIDAIAYLAHPYHAPTIGWLSDIEGVSTERLREFYDTFYWPNNATVTIIGDFDTAAALGLIEKYYAAIPSSPKPFPEVYTAEPPQQGPRRTVVKRAGEVGAVGIAYKTPPGLHADYPALEVLSDILTDGKTSRLYRALIDKNLAIDVSATPGYHRDNELLKIFARLAPGATHDNVEKIMLAEIARLKSGGVTPDEVARAISKENAGTAYGRDGSFAIASQLNESIAAGDWTSYLTMPDRIKAVTAADVNRVAKTYLQEDQSTTGWFIPVAESGPGGGAGGAGSAKRSDSNPVEDVNAVPPRFPSAAAAPAAAGAGGGASPAALIAPNVSRRKVAGIDVLTLKTSLHDVVTIRGSLPAGAVFNPAGHPAYSDLAMEMTDKGTTKHDKFALSQLLEDVGADISFAASQQDFTFNAMCLKKDVPLVLGLLAEQLRMPAFRAAEFDKLKKQLMGGFQEQMQEPDFRARIAISRAIFPEGHPNRAPDSKAYLADLAAAKLADVKAFHDTYYGPAGMTLVAVGDIDDATIDAALKTGFGGWTGGRPLPAAAKAGMSAAARTDVVAMTDKTSVAVYIGQPSQLKYTDPDRLPLYVGSQVFGGGYFSSRLLATVRNKEGLTYGIGVRMANDTYTDGAWEIQATFAPKLLDKGMASTQRELRQFVSTGVTANELRDFKAAIIGTYKLALATSGGLANQLLATVQRGLPVTFVDDYQAKVESVSLDQVNSAVKKYLDPDRMITVEAGTLELKGK